MTKEESLKKLQEFLHTYKVSNTDIFLVDVVDMSLLYELIRYAGFTPPEAAHILREVDFERKKRELKK